VLFPPWASINVLVYNPKVLAAAYFPNCLTLNPLIVVFISHNQHAFHISGAQSQNRYAAPHVSWKCFSGFNRTLRPFLSVRHFEITQSKFHFSVLTKCNTVSLDYHAALVSEYLATMRYYIINR